MAIYEVEVVLDPEDRTITSQQDIVKRSLTFNPKDVISICGVETELISRCNTVGGW